MGRFDVADIILSLVFAGRESLGRWSASAFTRGVFRILRLLFTAWRRAILCRRINAASEHKRA